MDIRDPVALGYTRATISKWREQLFYELGPSCVICGRQAHHLHEGILWRSEVMGFGFPLRLRVFSDCNSYPLCAQCHKSPPPREVFFAMACQKYGENQVRRWYAGFSWRCPPIKAFMPVEINSANAHR